MSSASTRTLDAQMTKDNARYKRSYRDESVRTSEMYTVSAYKSITRHRAFASQC